MDALNIKNLHKAFGTHKVLQGIDLHIAKGESFAIIGGSGSGKSVLLKCILGLLTADKGAIHLMGQNLLRLSKRRADKAREKIGMLFQNGALFDSLPVWHNISFDGLHNGGLDKKEAYELARKTIALVGLDEDMLVLDPAALSLGAQKCVGLARAIAKKPPILFFDEPTTGLDPLMTDRINQLIANCTKQLGASTLTITHDISTVHTIADRAGLLYEGQLIWQGSAKNIHQENNPYIHQFVNGLSEGPLYVEGVRSKSNEAVGNPKNDENVKSVEAVGNVGNVGSVGSVGNGNVGGT